MSAGISASRSTAPNRLPAASDGWSAFTARVGISLLWSAMLATAIGAVYSGGLRGGMILDDSVIITNNPSIRSLRHLGQVLNPPHDGSPVQGRPVMNLSLALGYALGRENVFGYHLFNVTIHLLNALLLFGVVVVLAAYHVGRSLLARPAFAWALSAVMVLAAATTLGSVTALRHHDYQTEFSICDDVIRKCPSNPRAYNNRGNLYHAMGQNAQAIADADEAIRLNPDFALAFNNRGNAYNSTGRQEQAIADYDEAIGLRPDFAEAYVNRGAAYQAVGRNEQAVADFDRAIRLNPDYAEAYINRGSAYFIMRRYEEAIVDYDQAIRLKPDYVEAYKNRGNTYRCIGRNVQAIADYDRAIRLKPDYPEAYNSRGNEFQTIDRFEQAIADYGQAIRLRPGYADAYGDRSIAYFRLGDYDKAWADIRQCRRFGGTPNPELVRQLTQASGRSE